MEIHVLLLADRLTLGVVFLVSALGKLQEHGHLDGAVAQYGLVTPRQARLIARTLPPLEVVAAILCISGFLVVVAASLLIVLLCAFTAAVVINMKRGRIFRCHCFGSGRARIGGPVVLRNLTLLALSLILLVAVVDHPAYGALIPSGRALISILGGPAVLPTIGLLVLSLAFLFGLSEVDTSVLWAMRGQSGPRG